MIAQTYPLYAVRNGQTFLVVGWVQSSTTDVYPVLAPRERPNRTYVHCGQDLTFQVNQPGLDLDATATIPAYR